MSPEYNIATVRHHAASRKHESSVGLCWWAPLRSKYRINKLLSLNKKISHSKSQRLMCLLKQTENTPRVSIQTPLDVLSTLFSALNFPFYLARNEKWHHTLAGHRIESTKKKKREKKRERRDRQAKKGLVAPNFALLFFHNFFLR